MNIRIKELFKSDLDPNSSEWWSKDKIDKINFNFRLMKNGGPSGPVGIEGPNGEDGDKGEDGLQGTEGPRGTQGMIGPESSGTWKSQEITDDNNPTQRVIYPSVAVNQSGTVTLAIGASAHLDSNGELISPYYGELSTEPVSASKSGTLNIITEASTGSSPNNPTPSPQNSIIFAEDKHLDKSYNIGLKIEEDSNNIEFPVLTFTPDINADHVNNKFAIKFDRDNRFYFNGTIQNVLGAESVIPYELNVDATSPGSVIEFKVGEIKYSNHSPSLNKLLKSHDTQGRVEWEDVFNMFQVFPVGSIIRIPSDTFFGEENFNLSDAETGPMLIVDGDEVIKTNFGSGKPTGLYAGWYLCNGETWGDGGIVAYDTPNLNGFDWDITNIAGLTGDLSGSTSGGSLATYNGNILFSGGVSALGLDGSGLNPNVISHSFDNSTEDVRIYDNENIQFAPSEHIIMGEQISIIYLKEYDYKWSTAAASTSSSNIQLQYHAMTGSIDSNTIAPGTYSTNIDIAMQYATTLNPETIQWTADGAPSDGAQLDAYWNNDNNFANGNVRCYSNGQELADGWLARESGGQNGWGYARKYINGVGISSDDALETEPKECWMMYSESVNGVDGTYSSIGISNNGLLPPVTMTEADVTGFTGWPAGTSLEKVFISNKIDNHPDVVGSSSDFKDYENTSHIWKRNDGNNTIDQLTDGWYRSVPNTDTYLVNFGFGGMLTIDSGLYMAWRKYWSANDNEFKGDVIKSRFVQWSSGDLSLGIGATTACDATSGNDIFYSSDMFELGENPGSWRVTNLGASNSNAENEGRVSSWLSNQIYVRQDQSSNTVLYSSIANLGKYPLTLLKSDTFIPGTNISIKIADWTGDSGTSGYTGEHYKAIDSNSQATATNPTECSGGSPSGVIFDWDDGNTNNTLNYFGGGGNGNVYFTLSGISPSQLSSSNFTIEDPSNSMNWASVSFNPGDNYVSLSIMTPIEEPSEILDLDFDYSGTLNELASDTTIGISIDPCHVEGTVISMANGTTKLVENLKVGDVLDSFDIKGLSDSGEWRNFKTNAMEFRAPKSSAKIVRIIKGTYKNYQDINNGLTKITNEHPILIKRPDGEIFFKQALYIDTTDMIYVNEKWTRVNSNETIHKTVNTYSIDVENEDVYIADGILCHNVEELEEKVQ